MDKDLSKTFLVSSNEAIWQLGIGPNSSGLSTWDGYYYPALRTSYQISTRQINLMNGDKRFSNWAKSFLLAGNQEYYPYKYKVMQAAANSTPTEHFMVLRLAEQYLIRAEARAMQGKFMGAGGANEDLNQVRARVDLPELLLYNLSDFMPALETERQLELFTEWGHRWFDLKRWKGFSNPSVTRADEVMPAILAEKGGVWKPESRLWPIPESEILVNVNLDQNPGY
jgi:starch-binding outer membrane protein, SusD/RagB family